MPLLKNGLPNEYNLFRSLVKGQPKTIHEMLQRVRKYLLLEEVVGAPSLERKVKKNEKSQGTDNQIFKKARFERKVMPAQVSNQEFNRRDRNWQRFPKTREQRIDMNKFCVLHKSYRHSTKDCKTIKA